MSISSEKLRLILGLLLAILIPAIFGSYIPTEFKAASYSLSLSLKQILLFVLPFITFSFVFSCLLSFSSGIFKLITLLIISVFLSNMLAIFSGYFVGSFFVKIFEVSVDFKSNNIDNLKHLWDFYIPITIPNKYALISGFLLGIYFSFRRNDIVDNYAKKLNFCANFFLKKIFIPIIPIFIIGFVFKLEHDQMLTKALKMYGPFFFVVIGTQISYMLLIYMAVAKFNVTKALGYLKNVLPATLTGFSTISSAASMPVLIVCSQKNTLPKIAETIIPATINIHTLGSAIGITILTITTTKMFNMPLDFASFSVFAFYYALAKFAVAAVPGGVIVVVYPLLETYLNFTPDMLGLITAMYMLFDPFGTATNVTGNGAFVIGFGKIAKSILTPDENNIKNEV